MNRKTLQDLRLDRRLLRRRGGITGEALERELAALPDVSDKIAPPEPEPEPPASGSDQSEAE